jgi:hypothetical protein
VQVGNLIGTARGEQMATLTSTCGANTCFDRFDVLGWNGEQFISLMSAPLQLPSATFRLAQRDQDPALEIEAQGGVMGSVGAGPQRPEKQVWKWNGAQYAKISSELPPVEYRIHAVYEGDDAKATDWYSCAIVDDALKDWHAEIGYKTQTDRATLTAYARFRLLVIGALRGDVNASGGPAVRCAGIDRDRRGRVTIIRVAGAQLTCQRQDDQSTLKTPLYGRDIVWRVPSLAATPLAA